MALSGVRKWCDEDYIFNAHVTGKELKRRKELALLTTAPACYLAKHAEEVKARTAALPASERKGKYQLKFVSTVIFPELDASSLEVYEIEASSNRCLIHNELVQLGLAKPQRASSSGGSGSGKRGRKLVELVEGWVRVPERTVCGITYTAFYYNPSSMEMTQTRPMLYSDTASDGLPLPPNGLMVKGARMLKVAAAKPAAKRAKPAKSAKPAAKRAKPALSDSFVEEDEEEAEDSETSDSESEPESASEAEEEEEEKEEAEEEAAEEEAAPPASAEEAEEAKEEAEEAEEEAGPSMPEQTQAV